MWEKGQGRHGDTEWFGCWEVGCGSWPPFLVFASYRLLITFLPFLLPYHLTSLPHCIPPVSPMPRYRAIAVPSITSIYPPSGDPSSLLREMEQSLDVEVLNNLQDGLMDDIDTMDFGDDLDHMGPHMGDSAMGDSWTHLP